MNRRTRLGLALVLAVLSLRAAVLSQGFYQRGTIYLDWYGTLAADGSDFNQVSTRVRWDLISRPGTGWTLSLDARDRVGLLQPLQNQAIIYNGRLTYDSSHSRVYFSLGQMNLYDSAGIGELLGAVAGWKITPDIMAGGYGGLESDPYVNQIRSNYLKFGAFVRWLGTKGKSVALSVNQLQYAGQTERRYAYANVFLPIEKLLVLYGDTEYELGAHTSPGDRLSRAFVNARLDLGRWVDVTGSYSSGKGLDYHQFLIQASQDPSLSNQNIERFYYSRYGGVRFSLKPVDGVRLSVSRLESEQKDQNIINHTWRFSASAWNLFRAGLAVTGDYTINRGDQAESNSYYASVAKDLGRFSLQASFSNTYNGVRFDSSSGTPTIIHMDNYRNIDLSTFITISRAFMVSLEYDYFLQSAANRHYFYVRLIYRTY